MNRTGTPVSMVKHAHAQGILGQINRGSLKLMQYSEFKSHSDNAFFFEISFVTSNFQERLKNKENGVDNTNFDLTFAC